LKGKVIEGTLGSCSGMLVLKKGVLKSFRLPEVFEESSEPVNSSGKEEYELAKQGIVSSEILHLTKQHRQGREKIQSFLKNPLMPKEIQDLLNEILYDIHYNLCCPLRQELEKFIVYICSSEVVETRFPLRMNYTATYNRFQRKSKRSSSSIEKIEISKENT